MANVYDQFNDKFNSEDLKKELDEVAANGGKGEYKEVPCGDYEVSISHLELKASKRSGNPMISCRFHILEGEFKKQIIFYNQVVSSGRPMHFGKEFLASLETDIEVTFDNWTQFGQMVEDIDSQLEGAEFALEYGESKNGYKTYKITKRFK